jgi:FkbM family methyltransferase
MNRLIKALRVGGTFLGNLGFASFSRYLLSAPLRTARKPYRLTSPYARYPLWVRAGTSDIYVFDQIFSRREYRCLDELSVADLVIDCGANVGYSATYFLTRFPQCHLIAIEPDPLNFSALQRNTAAYGERSRNLLCAVWPHETSLVMSEENSAPGQEWGRTVREARAGETSTLKAIDSGTLIRTSGFQRCSILKMDIEGAEELIFESTPDWLSLVDALVIEIHSRKGESLVRRTLQEAGFKLSQCDELLVGLR